MNISDNEMLGLIARTYKAYATIYVAANTTAAAVPTGSTYTKLSTAGAALGAYRNCTPSIANSNITIGKAGKYLIICAFSSKLGTTDVLWDTAVFINDVEEPSLHMRRRFSTLGYTFNVAVSGITPTSLEVGDIIDIRVKHNNASSVNITNEYANISVVYVDA